MGAPLPKTKSTSPTTHPSRSGSRLVGRGYWCKRCWKECSGVVLDKGKEGGGLGSCCCSSESSFESEDKRAVWFGKKWSEYEREKDSGHEASARHLTITKRSGSGRKSQDSDSTDMLPLHRNPGAVSRISLQVLLRARLRAWIRAWIWKSSSCAQERRRRLGTSSYWPDIAFLITNAHRNLFAIDYCKDHIVTCEEFAKVWINMATEEKEVCLHYTHRWTDSYRYAQVYRRREEEAKPKKKVKSAWQDGHLIGAFVSFHTDHLIWFDLADFGTRWSDARARHCIQSNVLGRFPVYHVDRIQWRTVQYHCNQYEDNFVREIKSNWIQTNSISIDLSWINSHLLDSVDYKRLNSITFPRNHPTSHWVSSAV